MTFADFHTKLDTESIGVRLAMLIEESGGFLFHSDGEAYVRFVNGERTEIIHVRSSRFKSLLTHKAIQFEGKAAGSEAIESAIRLIESVALFSAPEIQLHNRVARHEGALYFDLADKPGRCAKVTPEGWEVLEAPILFRRYKHQRPAVIPSKDDRTIRERLELFFELVNHDPDTKLLHLVELVFSFIPDAPHPIPIVFGEQGSAKSCFFKIWKALVDPSQMGTATLPRKQEELIQKLSHHWFLSFDNISSLWEWQSDALCRSVTGEGFSKRKLYSNDEDIIYNYKRVVGLNGINVAAGKPDLLDRSILHKFPAIPLTERLTEADVWDRFDRLAPVIMGAVFDTVSKAITLLPEVNLSGLYRMADFTRWGCAIAEAIGFSAEEFLKEYADNQNIQNTEALENDPVGCVILEKWNQVLDAGDTSYKQVPATAYEEFCNIAESIGINPNSKDFPQAPNAMSRRIESLNANLKKEGIEFKSKKEGGIRYWYLLPLDGSDYTVQTVPSSRPQQNTLEEPSEMDDTSNNTTVTVQTPSSEDKPRAEETATKSQMDDRTIGTINSETKRGIEAKPKRGNIPTPAELARAILHLWDRDIPNQEWNILDIVEAMHKHYPLVDAERTERALDMLTEKGHLFMPSSGNYRRAG